MLRNSFFTTRVSVRRTFPSLTSRKSSIITASFMVLAAWKTSSGSIDHSVLPSSVLKYSATSAPEALIRAAMVLSAAVSFSFCERAGASQTIMLTISRALDARPVRRATATGFLIDRHCARRGRPKQRGRTLTGLAGCHFSRRDQLAESHAERVEKQQPPDQ